MDEWYIQNKTHVQISHHVVDIGGAKVPPPPPDPCAIELFDSIGIITMDQALRTCLSAYPNVLGFLVADCNGLLIKGRKLALTYQLPTKLTSRVIPTH
ncbi:hypothetical protein EON65_50335 [archaeon]|nr:MAG: hypothetical protein EON65_50335 [archaeon]